ncbi:hypothetical protein PFTANZ_05934, partial [Plasmodium falciparum Tanzania (2000708)]
MSKINGTNIDEMNHIENQLNSSNNQLNDDNYNASKNFSLSNYNLDLIKCLQDDSGIYFILDPSKAINEKKQSDVYDIFVPEDTEGVTLHVQKMNDEYKCIGVSITKKGIDINSGTRIFNSKISDWLEQLFVFNKNLINNGLQMNEKMKKIPNNTSVLNTNNVNSGASFMNGDINGNINIPINAINYKNDKFINKGSNINIINEGSNLTHSKNTNYNNMKRASGTSNLQDTTTTNLIKNKYNNLEYFENKEKNNLMLPNNNNNNINNMSNMNGHINNSHLSNKKGNKNNNQHNCNINHNINNNNNNNNNFVGNHNLPSSQMQKQNRLNLVNNNNNNKNAHSNKSNTMNFKNMNFDEKNSKLFNNISASSLLMNKNILSNVNALAAQISLGASSEFMKNNKLGVGHTNNNRQKNNTYNLHNHLQNELFNLPNHLQNNLMFNNNNNKSQLHQLQNSQNQNNVHQHIQNQNASNQQINQSYNDNFTYRPTLFNLLEVLANHNITTPDQRVCIRGIVTDFLNNELPHGKIYAYIGAVVGHDILHDIIKKLEKDPNRNVVPDASGLARIEAAFGLSKSSYDFINNNSQNSTVGNLSNVLFNNRNLNSALLNNQFYSNILSNVANNALNANNLLNNNERVSLDNDKILSSKAAADISNLLKYAKNEKMSMSANNNVMNFNRKKGANFNNLLNLRNDPPNNNNNNNNNMNTFNNNNMNTFNNNNNNSNNNHINNNINNFNNNSRNTIPHDLISAATRNFNIQCQHKNSFSDEEEELMKVIKKNIESYKMNNIKNILISSVFGRIKWLKIMNESPHAYLYGHSIVKFGNKLYMFGGSNGKNKKIPFTHTLTFSLIYYNYKLLPLSGNCPEEREGHTTHLVSLHNGLSVFLFGGSNENIYYNDIYLLDMETRKWTRRSVKGKIPLPRDQHSSLVYPAKCEHVRGEKPNLTEGVIIFGGKCLYNNSIVSLNDMWIFSFDSILWIRINYLCDDIPMGRFGMNLVWSDTNTICLFGGEYCEISKTHKERTLLDDMWIFKVHNNVHISANSNDGTSYNNGMDKTQNDKNHTHNNNNNNNNNSSEKNHNMHSNDKEYADNVKDKYNNNKKFTMVGEWYRENYEGDIGCRSNYSSVFITQRHQDFKGAEPKTIERLMILCSGITYVYKDNKQKIVSTDEVFVYFFSQKKWYLLKGKLCNDEYLYNGRQRHVGCFFESKNVLGRANRNPVPCVFIQGGFKKNSVFGDAWLLSLTGENPLRIQEYDTSRERISTTQMPLYYFRDTHSISLLYSFCTLQKWLFGAFANLVDNCVHAHNPAENVFIKYELTPEHDGMLSIQDDGEGLDFNAMNRVLRMYGNYKYQDNSSVVLYNSGTNIKKHALPNNDFINNKGDDYNDYQYENEYSNKRNTSSKNVLLDDASSALLPHKKKQKNTTDNDDKNNNNNNENDSNNEEKDNITGDHNKNGEDENKVGSHNAYDNDQNNGYVSDDYYTKNYDQELFYNENVNNIFDVKYGVGFKMSFARISSSCAIMSRTFNTIGIGLLSLELMNHCEAKELATPLCMWKLPNKELINRNIANKSEHRHHQKLLMSYTPFNSPSLLAEQINILGTYSGTRLLYWDFRDDMDFIIFSPLNNNIYLSSSPLSVDEIKYNKKKKNNNKNNKNMLNDDNNNKQVSCVEDVKLNNRADIKRKGNFDEENVKKVKVQHDESCANVYAKNDEENEDSQLVTNEGSDKDASTKDENMKKEHPNEKDDDNNNNNENGDDNNKSYNDQIFKENEQYQYYNSTIKKLNLFEYNSHLNTSISKDKYKASQIFPLWDHPKDSIDYCLSTYLYWLYLRRNTNIFLQNTLLIPTCMRKNDNDVNSEKKKKKKKKKKGKKLNAKKKNLQEESNTTEQTSSLSKDSNSNKDSEENVNLNQYNDEERNSKRRNNDDESNESSSTSNRDKSDADNMNNDVIKNDNKKIGKEEMHKIKFEEALEY